MRTAIIAVIVLFSGSALAAGNVYVNPHTTSSGTYVPGHNRSAPDSNPYNNYSTQGNVNPYTGQAGTVQPQPHYQAPVYSPPPPVYNPPQPNYGGTNRGQSSVCPYGQRC